MADRVRQLLYLRSHNDHRIERMREDLPDRWSTTVGRISDYRDKLERFDVVYVPSRHDQLELGQHGAALWQYLNDGGHLIVNGHIVRPWLPVLQRFQAVPPRPFTNLRIQAADPGDYLRRLDFDEFHLHQGVLGLYARGWSPPPDGAQVLSTIGAASDPKPVDWLWQSPGGRLLMHNGDCLHWFPRVAEPGNCIILDILDAIVA